MSTTLLAQRLRALERAQVVERVAAPTGHGSRYYLTSAGQELAEVVLQMGIWGARWLDLDPGDYDAAVVLGGWSKFVDADRLPPHRVVVRRTVRDYEQLTAHHETIVYRAMIITMSRRLARASPPTLAFGLPGWRCPASRVACLA